MYNPGRDQSEYRPQFGGFRFFPPVIKYMIIINVVMYFLQNMLTTSMFTVAGKPLDEFFIRMTYLFPLGEGFKIWQLGTYMFLHGGFMHIFFNMLMLWMFGMEVENTWGSQRFLLFYFVCGISAGLSNIFIAPLFAYPAPTIGASGAVYGVLVAFAMMFPDRYIYMYFLLPIKAKYLIPFFLALEVFNGVTGTSDGVAHMAHLGGALVGAIWVILQARGVIDKIMPSGRIRSGTITGSGLRSSWSQPTKEATFYEMKPDPAPKHTGDPEFDRYQKVIDEILDKISRSGYAGLTEEEKRILLDASKRIHPDRDKGMNG